MHDGPQNQILNMITVHTCACLAVQRKVLEAQSAGSEGRAVAFVTVLKLRPLITHLQMLCSSNAPSFLLLFCSTVSSNCSLGVGSSKVLKSGGFKWRVSVFSSFRCLYRRLCVFVVECQPHSFIYFSSLFNAWMKAWSRWSSTLKM